MNWSVWQIEVSFTGEELCSIPHTIKARNADEASNKAAKYLAGRGPLLFKVTEKYTPLEVDAIREHKASLRQHNLSIPNWMDKNI